MQLRRLALLVIVLAACLLSSQYGAEAKSIKGSFKLSPTRKHDRVHYISQFACSIGECNYRIRAAIRSPFALVSWVKSKLAAAGLGGGQGVNYQQAQEMMMKAPPGRVIVRVVLDDEWETSHNVAPCDRVELARGRTTVQIPLNGTWGNWVQNTFRQTYKPHFWYFFAEDCRNSVADQLAKAADAKVEMFDDYDIVYEMEIFQADGSHLSFENVGLIRGNVIQLMINAGILTYLVAKQKKVMKHQRFQLHVMVQLLNLCLVVALWANVLQILHLWKLSDTGSRLPLLEGLAEAGSLCSQMAITACLILIAMGVTLNAPERMPLSYCMGMGALVVIVHTITVIVDKYIADPRYRYHSSEGAVGWILITFRFALWGLFLTCWHTTRTDRRTPDATDRFLRRVLVPASAYFLTFPLLLLLTSLCKPYWRAAFFFHASFILQIVAVIWLAEVFLAKGEYFRVSQMSQSFLPGGVWRPTVATHHVD